MSNYSSAKDSLDHKEHFFTQQRQAMVEEQIRRRKINNPRVLEAMLKVPRHLFIPDYFQDLAYNDSALAIDHSQTISQPYIVAYMTNIADIQPEDKVLEIGTGSGYQAAVLGELAREVYSVEVIPQLAHKAHQILNQLNYDNIHLRIGDGYQGWAEHAPYQKILVTAAPEVIPSLLIDQLAINGKMIVPVGRYVQKIMVITKTAEGITKEETIPVRFVPMVRNDR